MHPFVHAFSPAIAPPWETKTDFDAFHTHRPPLLRHGEGTPRQAQGHGGHRPCNTTRADATAQPGGHVLDWKAGECEPIPGKTMPKLVTGGARLLRRSPTRWPRSGRWWKASGSPPRA